MTGSTQGFLPCVLVLGSPQALLVSRRLPGSQQLLFFRGTGGISDASAMLARLSHVLAWKGWAPCAPEDRRVDTRRRAEGF